MQFIVFILGALVAGSALVSYVSRHPVDLAVAMPEAQVASVAASGVPFREEGMIVLDDTRGAPGIPFIVYEAEGRPIVTKQLVFGDEDCEVYARELPCAIGPTDAVVPFSGGEHVRVTGRQVEERVYVDSLVLL